MTLYELSNGTIEYTLVPSTRIPGHWTAACCLPGGALAKSGASEAEAYERLRRHVPACYTLRRRQEVAQ